MHVVAAVAALAVGAEPFDAATVTSADLRVYAVPAVYERGRNPYQDALDAARDILTLEPKGERCYYRYLSFYNLPPAVRKPFADYVVRYHLNLLSRETDFAFGVWVTPTLLRVDMRDFGFDRAVWDRSADIDVYFHTKVLAKRRTEAYYEAVEYGHWVDGLGQPRQATREQAERLGWTWKTTRTERVRRTRVREREAATAPWLPAVPVAVLVHWTSVPGEFHCRSPVLRADWFHVQSARQFSLRNDERTGFGYYDFLGVKDRASWFSLVRLDEKLAVRARKELRSIIDVSGVSAQNRQVVRLASINGPVWGTLDAFDESDAGVAKQNLRRGQFRHDAEEWFGFLDNGLPATLAASAKGDLQSSAPDRIGSNDAPRHRGRDNRIHVNLACMECHDPKVLQPLDDWARKTYVGDFKLGSPDKEVDKELKRQYLSDLVGALQDDNELYRKAIWKCVSLSPHDASSKYAAAFYRYSFDRVGADRGAEEIGTTRARFLAALGAANTVAGKLDPVLLGFLKVPDYKVSRLEWEGVFGVAATIAAGYVPPDN